MQKSVLVFFISLVLVGSVCAQEKPVLPLKLQSYITQLESEKADLQGGAIALLYKGKVVYKTTFGHAKGRVGEITPKTLFSLASGSQPVTALGIALLAREGKISYDQKVRLGCLKNPVSLSNVMSHTTGYAFTGNAFIEQGLARAKILEKLHVYPAKCKPGGCYFYSNTLYGLVEEVLKTRNLTLEDALEELRRSLKRKDILTLPLPENLDFAYPHVPLSTKDDSVLKQKGIPPYYPKVTPAGAGIFTSLDAMVEILKLASGYRPDLVPKMTFERLYTPLIANRDIDKWQIGDFKTIQSYYGLGWRILKKKERPNQDLIFHSGGLSGVSTFMGFMPSQEIGIVILINQGGGWATRSGIDFWKGFFD